MRTEDGDLIRQCLRGDKTAFGFLVDKYKGCVYACAYAKLRNFADAEDVTQEVFIKAYQHLHALKGYDRFRSWLYAITSNLCKNFLRARANRPDNTFVAELEPGQLNRPALEVYQEQQQAESLHDALATLPEMYRQVLTLHYLAGMKQREIAEFLGVSVKAIESRLIRARAQLKEEMVTMTATTFDRVKLQASFTFRVMEAIKQVRIQPAPHKTTLPYALSGVAALVVLMLSLSVPYSPLYRVGQVIGSALPSQTRVLEEGEIAVEAIQVDRIISLAPEMNDGDLGKQPLPEPAQMFGSGKWEKKTDLPRGVAGHATSVANGEIFVTGGRIGDAVSTVYAYNPVTNTVTPKASMRNVRFAHVSSTVNEKVYVIGGVTIGGGQIREVTSAEVYDPIINAWEIVSEIPTSRGAAAACSMDGQIYVIGGYDLANGIIPDNAALKPLATVEVYDPLANQWQQKTDMPTARFGHSCAVVEGRIYVIGGSSQGLVTVAAVERYDPVADRWEEVTDLPTPRSHFASEIVNGKIYTISGFNSQPLTLHSTVEIYDPNANMWTKGADLLPPRVNHRTAAINGKIFAIAGENLGSLLFSSIEEFTPDFELPQSVNFAGKLPTTWGEVKEEQ